MQKNQLAIFDLDGTLYDTKEVNYRSYLEALKIIGYNVKIDLDYYSKQCNSIHYRLFLPKLVKEITDEEMDKVHKIKKSLYSNNLRYAKRNNHLFNIIDSIANSYYIALVTNANQKNASEILEKHSDKGKFDLIISHENIINPKPSPNSFEIAMNHFKMSPKQTIVFEDSDVGIQAAQKSGAMFYRVFGFN